ncbi:MAG TPA: YibE/F family protein [Stenomitos sp.]
MLFLRLIAAVALWLACFSTGMPAEAHLATQLFQGAETFESGVIRAPLPSVDFAKLPKMPNGLYQNPPEFKVNVELQGGAQNGQTVTIDHVLYGNPSVDVEPRLGERVLVSSARLANGQMLYRIADYDRRPILLAVTLLTLLLLLAVARGFGVRTILLTFGGGLLLFEVFLPLLIQGYFPLMVVGLASIVLVVAGVRMLLRGGSDESKAAVVGGLVGLVTTALALIVTFQLGHVTGLSSPDALVLYAQVGDVRQLDYRQLWLVGALLSTLGGLITASGLTARAIARQPADDPWMVGWQEQRALLPVLTLATGLLYFGFSLPLFLITHLPVVTTIQIAWPRFFNFEYLASLILAWQSGIVGLMVAGAATAWTARWLRKRHTVSAVSAPLE